MAVGEWYLFVLVDLASTALPLSLRELSSEQVLSTIVIQMDAGDGRKSLRNASEPRITYHAANRTFDRLFREDSLHETKEVVRKKLGLPENAVLQLAQLRADQVIDLEDDDDFDAFYSVAHSSNSVDVRVTVLSPPTQALTFPPNGSQNHASSPPPTHSREISMPDTTDANTRKRKVTFVDASPAAAQVVPPKKRRMSTSNFSIQSQSSDTSTIGGISSTQITSAISDSPQSETTNATDTIHTSKTTSSVQNDSAPSNKDPSAHSNGVPVVKQRKSKKLRTADEAGKDDSQPVTALPQSSGAHVSLADQHAPDEAGKKKKKKKKEAVVAEKTADGPLVATSGVPVEPADNNSKSDAKSAKKKKSERSLASSRFTEQLAEMITNSTHRPEPQSVEGKHRNGKALADTETRVDGFVSDNKAKSKSKATVSHHENVSPEPLHGEKSTEPQLVVDKSLEVESGGKSKRKKKKKASDEKPPTSAADLAAAAETLKALSMRRISRDVESIVPSGSAGDKDISLPGHGTRPVSIDRPLESQSSTLEALDDEISARTTANMRERRVTSKDNATTSITNVKPVTSVSIPSIPGRDERPRAAPAVAFSSSDDSSGEDSIIVPHVSRSSSQKPASVPFPDIDLDALLRGPRKTRLTVDEALSTELQSPKDSQDIILEEDELIEPKRRRSSFAMAAPSDSDEHDIASDYASDSPQSALPDIHLQASTETLPNLPNLPEHGSHSNDAVISEFLEVVTTNQGSNPDSGTMAAEGILMEGPIPVRDEPTTPIDDQDPIEPMAIDSRSASPIEDTMPIEITPFVPRRAGLRRRPSDKTPLRATTQPPTRKSARRNNTQPALMLAVDLPESGAKMTRSRSKQMVTALKSPLTSDSIPSHAGSQRSVQAKKVTKASTQIAHSQPATPTAQSNGSHAIFDAPFGEWAVLKGSSPTVDVESSVMLDELHSIPGFDEEINENVPDNTLGQPMDTKSSLFFDSASQEQFPYSQWQEDENGPSPSEPLRVASPAGDDSEDENEVEASIMSQDAKKVSGNSYRRLTDITSQRSLFSTHSISQPTSTQVNTTKEMYGALGKAYDDDDTSDSESDGDAGASHIPKSRRAGSKKTS